MRPSTLIKVLPRCSGRLTSANLAVLRQSGFLSFTLSSSSSFSTSSSDPSKASSSTDRIIVPPPTWSLKSLKISPDSPPSPQPSSNPSMNLRHLHNLSLLSFDPSHSSEKLTRDLSAIMSCISVLSSSPAASSARTDAPPPLSLHDYPFPTSRNVPLPPSYYDTAPIPHVDVAADGGDWFHDGEDGQEEQEEGERGDEEKKWQGGIVVLDGGEEGEAEEEEGGGERAERSEKKGVKGLFFVVDRKRG